LQDQEHRDMRSREYRQMKEKVKTQKLN
jgi:hypothetical protein